MVILKTAPASSPGDPPSSDGPNLTVSLEKEPQPTKKLPSDRIKFKGQLDIIRAYGALSHNGSRAVNYKDAARFVKMDPNTVSLMSGFLFENGFLERVGNDGIPTKPVVEYALAHGWSAETAPKKLAPILKQSWFGYSLLIRLSFQTMSEDEMIGELATEISASPKFKPRIAFLIDYAIAAGLVRRDGNMLVPIPIENGTPPVSEPAPVTKAAPPPKPEADEPMPAAVRRSFAYAVNSAAPPEGQVQFHVSIRVGMDEIAKWSPDRITAFFNGLALVLRAKKGDVPQEEEE